MNKQQDYLKLHEAFEKKAFSIIYRAIRKMLREVDFSLVGNGLDQSVIEAQLNKEYLRKALYDVQYIIYIQHGGAMVKYFDKLAKTEQKAYNPLPLFNEQVLARLKQYFETQGLLEVVTISQTIIKKVVNTIKNKINSGINVRELAKEIKKEVNSPNFYKLDALRIARTEVTSAMNGSRELAAQNSVLLLDKKWNTVHDSRVRTSHIYMDRKEADVNGLFHLNSGVILRYPADKDANVNGMRDRKTVASEVVNCRCYTTFEPRYDANGLPIRK